MQQPLLQKHAEQALQLRAEMKNRASRYIDAFSSTLAGGGADVHPKLAKLKATLGPAASTAWTFLAWSAQQYCFLYKLCYETVKVLPTNVIKMIFGIALCFFGGTFLASIAAIEAFRSLGGKQVLDSLRTMWREGEIAYKAITVDADGNGKSDLEEQYQGTELARQQVIIGMAAVKDPELLQTAMTFLYTSWISVLATLKVQFARTTALAMGIADCLKLPMCMVFGKVLAFALGPDLSHWVETIIDISIKVVAVAFAWYIQAMISAFYSGLRGGRIFAESFISMLQDRGLLNSLPDFLVPKKRIVAGQEKAELDMDSTYLDEILMFPVAAAGFMYQLSHGFTFVQLPIVIKIILLPLAVIEWIIEWKITWG